MFSHQTFVDTIARSLNHFAEPSMLPDVREVTLPFDRVCLSAECLLHSASCPPIPDSGEDVMPESLPRREMLKTAAVAGGATLLASSLVAADEKERKKDKPKERKGREQDNTKGDSGNTQEKCSPVAISEAVVTVPPTIGPKTIATNVSPDKLAQSIVFDSLQATYGPEQAAMTFSPVKTAFLEIPVTMGSDPDCELLGYTVDVRGNVDLTKGARACVVVILAGVSEQIEFPYENSVVDRSANGNFSKRFFFVAQAAGIPGKTVVRGPLRLQLILSVETASPTDAAVFSVESVDVEARRAK